MRFISTLIARVSLVIFCFLLFDNLLAQNGCWPNLEPIVESSQVYGNSGQERLESFIATSDGGYISAGLTYSPEYIGDAPSAIWIMKFDSAGELTWQKFYGGEFASNNTNYDVVEGNDGYVIVGKILNDDQTDGFFLKVDFTGEVVWTQTVDNNSTDNLNAISYWNNLYVAVGWTYSIESETQNAWIVVLEETGDIYDEIIYEDDIAPTTMDKHSFFGITAVEDGVILAGLKNGMPAGSSAFAVKLNDDGNGNFELAWESVINNIPNGSDTRLVDVFPDPDGNYVFTGSAYSSGASDILVVKLDEDGNELWQQTWGGSNNETGVALTSNACGQIIVVGQSYGQSGGNVSSNYGLTDAWVLKLTSDGDLIWEKNFGGGSSDTSREVTVNEAGKIVMAGISHSINGDLSINYGVSDGWILEVTDAPTDCEILNTYTNWAGPINLLDLDFCSTESINAASYVESYNADECIAQTYVLTLLNDEVIAFSDNGLFDISDSPPGDYKLWAVNYFEEGMNPENLTNISDINASYCSCGVAVFLNITIEDCSINSQNDGCWLGNDPALNLSVAYGPSGDDYFESIINTSDGGYLAVGRTNYPPAMYAVKTDASGAILWENTYEETNDKELSAFDVVEGSDAYVLVGQISNNTDLEYGGYIAKIDYEGEIIWSQSLDVNNAPGTLLHGVTYLNNRYIAVGSANDSGWITVFDEEGNVLNSLPYDDPGFPNTSSYFYGVEATLDGGVVIAGERSTNNNALVSAFAVKLVDDGLGFLNPVWTVTMNALANNADSQFIDVAVTAEGEYVLAGVYDQFSTNTEVLVVKLDEDGNEVWQEVLGDSANETATGVTVNNCGDVFLAISSNELITEPSGAIYTLYETNTLKLSADAAVIWEQNLGNEGFVFSRDILINELGEPITVGYAYIPGIIAVVDYNGWIWGLNENDYFTEWASVVDNEICTDEILNAATYIESYNTSEGVEQDYFLTQANNDVLAFSDDGVFDINGIAPGNYELWAINYFEEGMNPESLNNISDFDTNSCACGAAAFLTITIEDCSINQSDECWLDAEPILNSSETKGFSGQDRFESIINTSDGGYLAVGTTYSSEVSEEYPGVMWLMKLNAAQEVEWETFYGGDFSSVTEAYDVVEGSDGYVVVGNIINGGLYSGYVVKVNYDGSINWAQEVNTSGADDLLHAVTYVNGQYVAVGRADNSSSGWVVVLEENGALVDEFIYADLIFNNYEFYGVEATEDGGIIIAGSTSASTIGITAGIAVKFNDNGFGTYEFEWQFVMNNLPNNAASRFWDVAVTPDGEYVFSGNDFVDTFQDVLVVKLDQDGDEIWQQTFGGQVDELARGITVNDCGQIIVAGDSNSITGGDITANYGGYDAWVLKLAANGDLIWEKNFGGSGADLSREVVVNQDGMIILVGITNSSNNDVPNNLGANDAWLWTIVENAFPCNGPNPTIFTDWVEPTSQFDLTFCEDETINVASYVANFGTDECASQDYFLTNYSYDVLAYHEEGLFNTADFEEGDYLVWAINHFSNGVNPDTLSNIVYLSFGYCGCGDSDQLAITIEGCVPDCEGCEAYSGILNLDGDVNYDFCLEDDVTVFSDTYTNNECYSQYYVLATDVESGGLLVEIIAGDSATFDLANYAEGSYAIYALNITNDIDFSNFDFVDQFISQPSFNCLIDFSNPVLFDLENCVIDDCILVNTIPEIEWSSTVGGQNGDYAYNGIQTSDGGYLVVGGAYSIGGDVSNPIGLSDWWVVKLDASGQLAWEQSYGTVEEESAWDVIEVDSGHFVIAGNKGISNNAWAIRIDGLGNTIWSNEYGGSQYDEFRAVEKTSDGGLAFFGSTASSDGDAIGNNGGNSYWLVKTDAGGNLIWQNSYGSSSSEGGLDMKVTPDGGYIMTGQSFGSGGDVSGNYGQIDAWILKVDINGEIQWENNFGGSAYDYLYKIDNTPDGGYIAAGNTFSSNFDVAGANYADWWVVKLDIGGNVEWIKTFGGSGFEDCKAVIAGSDGYYLGGTNGSVDGEASQYLGIQDYWVMKLDFCGEMVWEKSYGGSYSEEIYNMQFANDGGLILSGYSDSNDGEVNAPIGFLGYWIAKLEVEEGLCEAYTDWIVEVETPLVYCPDDPIILTEYIEFNENDCYTQFFAIPSNSGPALLYLNNDGNFSADSIPPGSYIGYGLNVHEDELPMVDPSSYWSEDVPCSCFDLVEIPIVILEADVPPCGIVDCTGCDVEAGSIEWLGTNPLCIGTEVNITASNFNDSSCFNQYILLTTQYGEQILEVFEGNEVDIDFSNLAAANYEVYGLNIGVDVDFSNNTNLYEFEIDSNYPCLIEWTAPISFTLEDCTIDECDLDALTPAIEWEQMLLYDGGTSKANKIIQTTDGQYLVVGTSDGLDNWGIVKLDENGETVWDTFYGSGFEYIAYDAVEVEDGYVVVGHDDSYHCIAIKLDLNGNLVWEQDYGQGYSAGFRTVTETSTGDLVFFGSVSSSNIYAGGTDGSSDTWLVKTDSNGNILFQQTYGYGPEDRAKDMKITLDGGFIMTGIAAVGYEWDAWVIKVDANGNIEWEQTYVNPFFDSLYSVDFGLDGGYILAGIIGIDDELVLETSFSDCWVIKLDENGETEWSKTFGGSGPDEFRAVLTGSDGYYLGGINESVNGEATEHLGNGDFWLVKLDETGELVWEESYGGSFTDKIYSMDFSNDGELILAGYSDSYDIDVQTNEFNTEGYWVVKLGADIPCEAYTDWNNNIESTTVIELCPDESLFLGGYVETYNDTECYAQTYLLAEAAAPNNILSINSGSTFNANDYPNGSYIAYALNHHTYSLDTDSITSIDQLVNVDDLCYDLEQVFVNILTADDAACFEDPCALTTCEALVEDLNIEDGTNYCSDEIITVNANNFNSTDCYNQTYLITTPTIGDPIVLQSSDGIFNTADLEEGAYTIWGLNTHIYTDISNITSLMLLSMMADACYDLEGVDIYVGTTEVNLTTNSLSVCSDAEELTLNDYVESGEGTWSDGTNIITTIDPSTAGINIDLYYTANSSLCNDTDTLSINITDFAEVELTQSALLLCENDPIVNLFDYSEPDTGIWSDGTNILTNFNPSNALPETTLYYSSGTGNCADTDTLTIDVLESAEVALLQNSLNLCVSDEVVLLNDFVLEGEGGEWYTSAIGDPVTSINPSNLPINTTIDFYYSALGDCVDNDTLSVFITDLAEVNLIQNELTICTDNETLILSDFVESGTGNWALSGTTIESLDPSLYNTTTLELIYGNLDFSSCGDSDTLTVNILEIAEVSLLQNSLNLCSADEIFTLNDLVFEGEDGQWTTTSGDIITTIDPSSLPIDSPTDLYYSSLGECVDTDTLTVTITNLAEVTLTQESVLLCENDGLINLSDYAVTDNGTWSDGTNILTSFDPSTALDETVLYYSSGTGDCADTDTLTIDVLENAEVSLLQNSLSLCITDEVVILNDLVLEGEGDQWYTTTGEVISTIDPSNLPINSSTDFYYSSLGDCVDSDTLTVLVTAITEVNLNQNEWSICNNDEPLILNNFVETGTGTWTLSGNNIDILDPSLYNATTLELIYGNIDFSSCGDSDTLTINILEIAEASLLQNSLSICNADDPINLNDLVSEGPGGQWTTTSGDIVSSVDPANLIVDNPTEFYYTSLGDCGDSDTLTVTTTNFIEVALTENTLDICSNNQAITLSEYIATGSGTWTLEGVELAIFDPASTNNEQLELIYGNTLSTCADSDTLTINIESNNQVSLLQSSLDICSNDELIMLNQLVSDGMGTWSDGSNEITNFDPSTATIDVLQELYFSSGTGECDDTDTLSIIVTAGAEVTLLQSTLNFCNTDEAIDLNNFVTEENGVWSDGINPINTFDPSTAASGTEIELFYTGGEAECADTDTLTITVDAFEEVEISEPSWSICNNDTPLNLSDFEVTSNGQWSDGTNTITNIDPSTTPINTLIELYYSSSENVPNECKDTDTLVLTVYEYIEVELSLSSLNVCTNDAIIDLEELATNANGSWTNEEGDIVNSFNPSSINEDTVSEFYYTANTSNCADIDTLTIETILSQEVTLNSTTTEICIDEVPLQLNDFVQEGDGLWIDQFNQTITSINPTDYGANSMIQAYYASGNGLCDDVDTLFISIIDVEEVGLIQTEVTFCKNDPITLLEDYVNFGNGQWTDENGFIVGQFNPETLDANSPTEFYYSAFSNTCGDIDTLTVNINQRPDIPIFTQPDYAFCSSDEEIIMSAEGENVLWYDMSNLSDIPTPGNLFQPTESGVYYVTQTVNGCTSMPAAISVLIEDFQEVAVNGFGGPLCAGDTIALNSLLINTPNEGYWTGEGVEDNSLITTNMNAGVYDLSYTIPANVCDDFSDQFEWELLAPLSLSNGAPQIECKDLAYQVNFTIEGGLAPYTINGEPMAGNSYTSEWRFRLDYEYIIEDANGCAYYITGRTPCPEVFLRPNPNNGEFWVSYGEELTDQEQVIVRGFDSKGRELNQEWITYTHADNHFTLDGLPAGIYLFVFQFKNESITKKVLIF